MTDQQINIAIAEIVRNECGNCGQVACFCREAEIGSGLPDYCNDLNAMHEAEMTLTKEQQQIFSNLLWDITSGYTTSSDGYVPGYWEVSMETVFPHIHATARQRAEVFLRTLGKWVE